MKASRHSFLRFLSRIWIRLLAFNILVVFLPVAGLWSLKSYERYLLIIQERSNVQQGRLLAAALGEDGPLVDDDAKRILINLKQRHDARLRIIDADMNLLADSSHLGPRLEKVVVPPPPTARETRESWVYQLGSSLYDVYEFFFRPPELPMLEAEFYAKATRFDGSEIVDALAGRYGNTTRLSKDGRSLTLYSAIPIRNGETVVGVALVSKSTFTILRMLYDLRVQTFKVVLVSLAVAVVLSLLVSTTIARPVSLLRREALAMLDRRGRLKGRFQPSRRLDEIGDLQRALHELTGRLEGHLSFIESFASDVSHEFKNPLASIRNATDLLAEVEDPQERERFHQMALHDLSRLNNLLSGVREISLIDAQVDEEPTEIVRLDELLEALVEQFKLRPNGDVGYHLVKSAQAVNVEAVPDRLAQVFENLLDNARSFSPQDSEVTVTLETERKSAVVRVADTGPGIPAEHRDKIFQRFFSYRPKGAQGQEGHTGLGLAIVRAIIESAGGTVAASDGPDGGAVMVVKLPLQKG
jgi:two-component system sensor histidine kinase ChvG